MPKHTMDECPQRKANARVLVRASEDKHVWGDQQVLQCRRCKKTWSE